MGTKDPRVDAYIAKSAKFAKPILTHLREMIHKNMRLVQRAACNLFPPFDNLRSWSGSWPASLAQHGNTKVL